MNSEIKIASTEEDFLKAWDVIHLLRPHLAKATYPTLMKEMLASGYQLAYIEEDARAVSIIGYRHLQFLFNGKHIYIDDLSTLDDYRGKGHASQLIDFVVSLAKEQGYEVVTLDSGTHRATAHRLYLNKGFAIESFHFSKSI